MVSVVLTLLYGPAVGRRGCSSDKKMADDKKAFNAGEEKLSEWGFKLPEAATAGPFALGVR